MQFIFFIVELGGIGGCLVVDFIVVILAEAMKLLGWCGSTRKGSRMGGGGGWNTVI